MQDAAFATAREFLVQSVPALCEATIATPEARQMRHVVRWVESCSQYALRSFYVRQNASRVWQAFTETGQSVIHDSSIVPMPNTIEDALAAEAEKILKRAGLTISSFQTKPAKVQLRFAAWRLARLADLQDSIAARMVK